MINAVRIIPMKSVNIEFMDIRVNLMNSLIFIHFMLLIFTWQTKKNIAIEITFILNTTSIEKQ